MPGNEVTEWSNIFRKLLSKVIDALIRFLCLLSAFTCLGGLTRQPLGIAVLSKVTPKLHELLAWKVFLTNYMLCYFKKISKSYCWFSGSFSLTLTYFLLQFQLTLHYETVLH